jgi:hypothetical protein
VGFPALTLLLFMVLALVVGIVAGVLYYHFNRVLTLGVVTESGVICWLRFKRSLLENIQLNEALAETASRVINSLVLARCAGASTKPLPALIRSNPLASSPAEMKTLCGHCAQSVAFPSGMVGQEIPCPTCGKLLLLWSS